MVQAHAVVQRERTAQTVHPPTVAVLLHVVPAERRVAPHLALGRKIVGRRAGNLNRLAGIGQPEVLGLAPRVGRIVRDVHRNVADNLDALLVRVVHELAPGQVKAILHVCLQLGLVVEALIVNQMLVVARDIGRPIMARFAFKVLLDGHVDAVLLEPVGIAMLKRRVQRVGIFATAGLPDLKVGRQLLMALWQQVDIARKGRRPGVRGAEEVRWVDRQNLPVAHAHSGQMVDKATRGRADRAGLAVVGRHRRDVAHDARAVIERLLQALLGVVIDNRRTQRIQVERDRAVVDHALVATNDVACTFAERRNRHAMRIAQAAVDDDGRGLTILARTVVSQHLVIERECLDLAVDHKRQRAAHGRGVLDDRERVEVVQVFFGRQGATVARVGKTLQAVLVAIVDGRHAGEGHLHERREPKAALGQAHCAFVQTPFAALALGQLRLVGTAAEHRDDARAIVARQQIERAGQSLARVVLTQGLDILGRLIGVLVAHQKADDHVAEGVVHGGIKLGALQVAAQMTVTDLVGGVLPDLAEQQRVGLFGKYCLLDLGQEIVRKLVSDVQTPAVSTGTQPFANHAILAQEPLVHQLGVLVDGGHIAHAPPAVVRAVLVEGKRIAPRRILTLPCTYAGVVAIAIGVD